MRTTTQNELVKGASASRRGPAISHLLFADDCMLFGEATEKGARILKDIIQEYEMCSGQCVNFGKSTIFYSSNTTEESKVAVSTLLGVRSSSSPERYLGLPNMVGRRKKEAFQNLVDIIVLKIDGWSTRLLSQGGKEIFIKAVLHAIPTYAMSKEEGGLGFRNMAQFNISLLAKQGWRLLNFLDPLVAQVFKAKYFPESNFLNSRLGNSCSYVWRSIWAAKDTLEKGSIWRVGTGVKISVTEDAWIPNYVNIRLSSRVDNLQFDRVADLIDRNNREWDRDLIVNTFPADVADLILQIPLSLEPHEDFLAWRGESSGVFSVRSSYKLLQSLDPTVYALQNIYRDFYRKLWQIEIPTKIKIFIWKISWNYLTNRVNMACRRLANSRICPRCGGGDESMNHLFRECPVTMEMWRALINLDLSTGTRSFVLHYGPYEGTEIPVCMKKRRHPPGQEIKINFDGAFDERSKSSASGVVVRNSSGRVLISRTTIHSGIMSAFAAEAVACRQATQITLDMNIENIIIEGDSLSVIKKCKNINQDKSLIGPFIHDIHRLKLRGRRFEFEYIPKSANNLAHILAKETLRRKEESYLKNGVPEYAAEQARNESVREPD
ncbi:reverse transcriptase [Gossypium australe]|uniref:Reverse transcriptase n=1 Tax=Gossypium australe TaxID=47621 RepID=A0A5B6WNT5_9ROSI|nr:reverse transcriptase [Gossypium australe]